MLEEAFKASCDILEKRLLLRDVGAGFEELLGAFEELLGELTGLVIKP